MLLASSGVPGGGTPLGKRNSKNFLVLPAETLLAADVNEGLCGEIDLIVEG